MSFIQRLCLAGKKEIASLRLDVIEIARVA
jgi:hypothetical protein